MRIALLGLCHETNTLSSISTDLAKFNSDGILRGEEIFSAHATAHTSLGPYIPLGSYLKMERSSQTFFSVLIETGAV